MFWIRRKTRARDSYGSLPGCFALKVQVMINPGVIKFVSGCENILQHKCRYKIDDKVWHKGYIGRIVDRRLERSVDDTYVIEFMSLQRCVKWISGSSCEPLNQ